jgi:hypothetical protein
MIISIFYSHLAMADGIAVMELLLNSKGYKLFSLDLFVTEISKSKLKQRIFMDPQIRGVMRDSASNEILNELKLQVVSTISSRTSRLISTIHLLRNFPMPKK